MDGDDCQIFHTVVISGLKDPTRDKKLALALTRIIKNMAPDEIWQRVKSLPWTLAREATSNTATRLVRYLEKAGARIEVVPPLPASVMTDAPETQILRDTHLLSLTEAMPTTRETPVPDAPPPQTRTAAPAQKPPLPIEPGSKIVPLVAPVARQTPPTQAAPADEGGFDIEPLSLGGILDKTFQICRAHFWKLFAVQAVSWAILTLVGIGGIVAAALAGLTAKALGKTPLWTLLPMGAVLIPIAVLALIALLLLSQGALIHAVSSVYLGREVRVRESYSFAFGRLRKLFFTYTIVILAVALRLLLVLVLGTVTYYIFLEISSSKIWAVMLAVPFWLALAYIPTEAFIKLLLVDVVIVVEDMGYMKAINRSWNLVSGKAEGAWPKGYFLRLFILFHLEVLIIVMVHVLFGIPGHLTTMMLPQTIAQILNEVWTNLGGGVASLFGSVCGVVFYYDIRSRKEGFDLEMLAERTTSEAR